MMAQAPKTAFATIQNKLVCTTTERTASGADLEATA